MMSANISSDDRKEKETAMQPAGRRGLRPLRTPRLWVWVVSVLSNLVCYPIATAIALGMQRSEIRRIEAMIAASPQDYVSSYPEGWQRTGMLEQTQHLLGFASPWGVLAAALAVLIGLEIFGYLHDVRTLDFYESQPMGRGARFRQRLLTGFATFAAPMLVCLLLAALIAAGMGALSGAVFVEILLSGLMTLAVYAAVYGITVLSSMLSGRLFLAGLMTGFLLLLEPVLRLLWFSYGEMYFVTWYDTEGIFAHLWTSPLGAWGQAWKTVRYLDGSGFAHVAAGAYAFLLPALHILLIALAALILAWICYRRRPAEFAGGALLFGWLQTAVKWITIVAAALFSGMAVNFVFGGLYPWVTVTVLLVVCAAGCIIGEMIFARNGRAALRRPWHIAVTAGFSLLVFASFVFDWVGYDRYVPAADRIESISFYPAYEAEDEAYYLDADDPLTVVFQYQAGEYFETGMRLSDPGTIEAVRDVASFAAAWMRGQADTGSVSWYSTDDGGWSQSVVVCYHLKNGRKVHRALNIPCSTETAQLDRILTDPAYLDAMYQFTGERALSEADSCLLYVDNAGSQMPLEDVTAETIRAFEEVYRADLEGLDYAVLSAEPVVLRAGTVVRLRSEDGYSHAIRHSYPVYESFARTQAFLKELGYRGDPHLRGEGVLSLELRVPVHGEKDMQTYLEEETAARATDAMTWDVTGVVDLALWDTVLLNYTDSEEIRAIMEYFVPAPVYSGWYAGSGQDASGAEQHPVYAVAQCEKQTVYSEDEAWLDEIYLDGRIETKRGLPAFLEEDIRAIPNQAVLE